MPQKIVINSKSNGKHHTEVINNRPHLVTEMVSIEGDSVMNGLLYPLAEVQNTYQQLDQLPAPAGHPNINGVNVSAFHPLAINAHHFGGMVRNSRMVGNQVISELVIDIAVANNDDRGKKIVEKIEAGQSIGVSTGLDATVNKTEGKLGNSEYRGVVSDIKYDHVAVLLDETPAGDTTYTINRDILFCNVDGSLNELREKVERSANEKFATCDSKYVWVADVLVNPDRAIVEMGDKLMLVPFGYDDQGSVVFTGEGVEVERKVTFEPVSNSADIINSEVNDMDKEKFVLEIIGNSANGYTMADKDQLMAMSLSQLVNGLLANAAVSEPTVEQAQKVITDAGMTINSADFDHEGFKTFMANKDAFNTFMEGKKESRGKLVEQVVNATKMTAEQVEAMTDDAIENLANSLGGTQDYSVNGQKITNNDRQADGKIALHEEA